MKAIAVVLGFLCAGCATPWAQVKDAKTIEEAWYFGKNECVLFVDGKIRLSKTSSTEATYESGAVKPRPDSEHSHVVCAPSELRD